jgi:hypothetical protein
VRPFGDRPAIGEKYGKHGKGGKRVILESLLPWLSGDRQAFFALDESRAMTKA